MACALWADHPTGRLTPPESAITGGAEEHSAMPKSSKASIATLVIVAAVAFVMVGPTIFSAIDNAVVFPWETQNTTTTIVPGGQVDLFMNLYHTVDGGAPAATTVWLYDANLNYFSSAASSSGLVTFTQKGTPGAHLWYQIRATAPNSATYVTYTTPLREVIVPEGDVNGDAFLTIAPVGIHETSTSVATFNVTDQVGQIISTEATKYVNSTDTSLTVNVAITVDCSYGTPEDFTDTRTGKSYLWGAWIVLSCTTSQGITNFAAAWSSPTLYYYAFRIPTITRSTAYGYNTHIITIECAAGFTASADFDFDLFDTCWASSLSGININSFMNGDSDLNPTALVNKVV